jgi:hypothetical protein
MHEIDHTILTMNMQEQYDDGTRKSFQSRGINRIWERWFHMVNFQSRCHGKRFQFWEEEQYITCMNFQGKGWTTCLNRRNDVEGALDETTKTIGARQGGGSTWGRRRLERGEGGRVNQVTERLRPFCASRTAGWPATRLASRLSRETGGRLAGGSAVGSRGISWGGLGVGIGSGWVFGEFWGFWAYRKSCSSQIWTWGELLRWSWGSWVVRVDHGDG